MDAILVEDLNFLKAFLDQDLYALAGLPQARQEDIVIEVQSKPAPEQVVEKPVVQAKSVPEPKPVVETKEAPIQYSGGNASQLLILVSEANYEYLSTEDLGLLIKILGAIQKTEKDIALVNLHHTGIVPWAKLNQTFNPVSVLTFGLPKTSYPTLVLGQQYTVVGMGQYKCLNADPLAALQGNDILKRKLWTALKTL